MPTHAFSVQVDGQTISGTGSFTVAPAPAPAATPLVGCSASSNNHGGTELWDCWRAYSENEMLGLANRTGAQRPKALVYSKDGANLGGTNPTVATVRQEVLDDLNAFYYTGGATSQTRSARWGIALYWSNGNENHDKGALSITSSAGANPHSASQVAAYGRSMQGLYEAAHYVDPVTGQRRFPDVYVGSDPTTEAERNGWVEDWLTPTAQWHDFVAWSAYPAGRKDTTSDPTYNWPTFSDANWAQSPHGWLLRCFRRTALAGVPRIGIGEFGIGDSPGDNRARPFWTVYYMHSAMRLATQYNLSLDFACWWDNQVDASAPQNILSDEPVATSPSTRQALQNHLAYNKYRGGAHPAGWPSTPPASWKQTGTFPTS